MRKSLNIHWLLLRLNTTWCNTEISAVKGEWHSSSSQLPFYFGFRRAPAVCQTPLIFFNPLFFCSSSPLFWRLSCGWKMFCFSFQSPKTGAVSQTWTASPGRSAQPSPKNRSGNWSPSLHTTTIWPDWDATKSPSTSTSRNDKYGTCWMTAVQCEGRARGNRSRVINSRQNLPSLCAPSHEIEWKRRSMGRDFY